MQMLNVLQAYPRRSLRDTQQAELLYGPSRRETEYWAELIAVIRTGHTEEKAGGEAGVLG